MKDGDSSYIAIAAFFALFGIVYAVASGWVPPFWRFSADTQQVIAPPQPPPQSAPQPKFKLRPACEGGEMRGGFCVLK